MLSLQRFQSPRQRVLRPRTGGRYRLHATAIGLVLLANAPREIQDEALSGDLPRYTPRTLTQRSELEAELADVRRRGYAIGDRTIDDDMLSVAAPVFAPDGTAIAALALVGVAGEDTVSALIAPVQLAVTSITRAIREQRRVGSAL